MTGPARINHVSAITPGCIFTNIFSSACNIRFQFCVYYSVSVNWRRKPIKFYSIGKDLVVLVQRVIKLWWSKYKTIGNILHSDGRFCTVPPICISYYFVIIHIGMDHRTWTRHVQFTHEYNQVTFVCTHVHTCPESAHTCDTHDMCVTLNL